MMHLWPECFLTSASSWLKGSSEPTGTAMYPPPPIPNITKREKDTSLLYT